MEPKGSELVVDDAEAWSAWLGAHEGDEGVWLVLARKGITEPTRLTYDDALEEAICHGWIDGQRRSRDEQTYHQRFTPRRKRSPWSKRNVGIVERLTAEGRMREAGLAEVQRAKDDGRWAAAYEGQAKATVPDDLATALAAEPKAAELFDALTSQNRYSILYRVESAKRPATRAKRITDLVAMLARGETIHPQRRTPGSGGAERR